MEYFSSSSLTYLVSLEIYIYKKYETKNLILLKTNLFKFFIKFYMKKVLFYILFKIESANLNIMQKKLKIFFESKLLL